MLNLKLQYPLKESIQFVGYLQLSQFLPARLLSVRAEPQSSGLEENDNE